MFLVGIKKKIEKTGFLGVDLLFYKYKHLNK